MWVIPAVCGLVAFLIRFWHLQTKSIWLDEALSWRAAHMSFSAMIDFSAGHFDTPLYYIVLSLWVKVAGNSEAALRMPSVLAGAFTVALLAWVGWRIGGALLGITAGVLLACNAAAVSFSQEARMYPLTGLVALGASVMLARFFVRPSRLHLGAYVALALALLYSHYSSVIVMGLHGTLFATYGAMQFWERRDKRVLVGGAVAAVLIGIGYLPWYEHFLFATRTGVPIARPTLDVVSITARSTLGLDWAGHYWLAIAAPVLALAAIGIARRVGDPLVICVAALAAVPVAMVDISLVRTPVFNLKQISPYIPGVCFVAAIGITEVGALLRKVRMPSAYANGVALAFAALIAGIAFRGTMDWYDTPAGEDWRGATASVRNVEHPVYIWQWWTGVAVDYYLGPAHATRPLSPAMQQTTLAAGYVPITAEHAGDEATFIMTHVTAAEGDAILNSLRPQFEISEPKQFWGVRVFSLRAKTIAALNVDVPDDATWTTTPDGYLRSGEGAAFSLRASSASAPSTIHIEYKDDSGGTFGIAASSRQGQRVELATIARGGSGTWKSADVPVDNLAGYGTAFSITPGVTIRTLEMRRYDVQGADVVRSGTSEGRQWFLRRDGYLGTIGPGICLWPTGAVDPALTPTMTIEMTYLDHGHWKDLTKTVPAAAGLSCPVTMPGPIVVRRLIVHSRS